MKKKILINAHHAEEKRVAIVDGETLVDFYVESAGREHLRGNIYKGTVIRVEPGLQAAFVDFGPKKHGFLQLREIMPQFYKEKEKEKGEGRRTRIQDLIVKGQEVIVQVEKDERDTKGASLTTYLSLPGRYIVMMPGQERVGISRKIEDKEDRDRLKDMFKGMKMPKDMGFILRTAGSDKTSEEIENDLKYLTKLWSKIQSESKKAKAPALIYREQDIAVRTIRDYLTSDVGEVLIDDADACKAVKEYLRKTVPWRKINVKLYKDKKPIFSRHAIEEQIAKVNDRFVHLPSRGYVVIDKTEALTAIDVNSGRSRKEENIEATALKTNLEAADELARQFRLRDIGGLIVIDFIDMNSSKNRREVEKRMKDALASDKAHTEMTPISKFGIMEMTRERMRTAFLESVNRKCDVCSGTGSVRTDEMAAVAALREMHMKASRGGVLSMNCALTVESLNYLINTKRDEIALIEKEYKLPVRLTADPKLLPGQYTLTVDKTEEAKAEEREQARVAQRQAHGQHPKAERRHAPKSGHAAEHKTEPKAERHAAHTHEADHTAGQAESEDAMSEFGGELPEGGEEQGAAAVEQPAGGEVKKRSRRRSRGRRRSRRGRGGQAGAAAPSEEGAAQPAETSEEFSAQ